jgi:hypothetical protein
MIFGAKAEVARLTWILNDNNQVVEKINATIKELATTSCMIFPLALGRGGLRGRGR